MINPSEIGVMITNLANELGHHLVSFDGTNHQPWLISTASPCCQPRASPNPLTRAGVQKHIVGSQECQIFLGLLMLF